MTGSSRSRQMPAPSGTAVAGHRVGRYRHLSAAQLGDWSDRRRGDRARRGLHADSAGSDRRGRRACRPAAVPPRRQHDRSGHLPLLRRRLRGRCDADGALRGDTRHPANCGRLCSKGAALDTLGMPGRLLTPMIHGRRAGWDKALNSSRRSSAHPRRARPGQRRLLRLRPIPDRGLLRRQQADEGLHRQRQHRHELAAVHGVLGRRPRARVRRGRGARRLRGLEEADLVVLVGSNTAWCHPVLHQRMQAARRSAAQRSW